MEEVCRRSKGKRLYSTAYCISIVTLGLVQAALAQNQTIQPTTDPSEASALNTIFQKWGLSAPAGTWITNNNICTGRAVDNTSFDNSTYNPFIKCDCSFNNGSICHITQLKVYAISGTGTIPDELGSLTYLTNLVLAQNVLTGPLPPSIGNLTRLQRLSLSINALSGELPKELGMLSNLLSLSIALNNFSGPLPSELGNLTKLDKLYFNSAGVSGPLPSTFANLRNLKVLWASDNELTGPIPDFIGNWSKLTQLFLHGTSFDGPIPSSLSTLISLTDLRISGILSGNSSLAFIKDMKNLTTEYAMRGHLTEKTDVFAFGVVALELVSGRHNFDESLGDEKAYLLEWAWKLHEAKQEIQLIDQLLLEFDEEEVKRVATLGLLCTQTSSVVRPTMSRVVTMLMGDAEVSPVTTKPGYLTNWRYNDNGEEAPILGNSGRSSKSEYPPCSGTAGISVSFTSEGR